MATTAATTSGDVLAAWYTTVQESGRECSQGVSRLRAGSDQWEPVCSFLTIPDVNCHAPVLFTDGSPSSGLSYSYVSLGSPADNLSFSANGGVTYAHVPIPDADGCDPAITHFRVQPTGSFAPGTTITLRARFRIR